MNNVWLKMYDAAKKYYLKHNNLEVKAKYTNEEGIKLGAWISNQRRKYKIGKLSKKQIELLNSIGMLWKIDKQTWKEMYDLAKNYYNHNHNLKISKNFITKNGYEYDKEGLKLGIWIGEQRKTYKQGTLSEERKLKLNQIGMIWEVNKEAWDKMYKLALKYYEKNKNLKVPIYFKTKDGYTYDEEGVKLGVWIGNQRQIYNSYKGENRRKQSLTTRQIYLLNDIEMIWDASLKYDEYWQKMYDLAEKYYNHYKKLDIPLTFRTKNGYEYNKDGEKLGKWIQNQRRAFKAKTNPKYAKSFEPLSKEKEDKLEKIGMIWNIYDYKWYSNYEIAKTYYLNHGNLEVSGAFKTKDGIVYDEEGINLYNWLNQQRKAYKKDKRVRKLTKEQINLLDDINMPWENKQIKQTSWEIFYPLAQNYYNYHHNLDIIIKFKTKNGYEYDEEGKNLGMWIKRQRYNYKKGLLTKEQIMLLNEIEMIWQKLEKKPKEAKFNKIDEGIAYKELIAKINLLTILNAPLVINGNPHPIIYMNDSELQKNLNISLEDLIYNFYSEEKAMEVNQTINKEKTLVKRLIK